MEKQQEILFTKYKLVFEENTIINVLTQSDKATKFSYTFYEENKATLDNFINIMDYVKPKVEREIKNNIIINLDSLTIGYSNNSNKVSEQDLKVVMGLLKYELSNSNEEVKALRKDIETLTNERTQIQLLIDSGMDILEEELNKKQEEINNKKQEIEEILIQE